jgi:hypothetical protein
MGKATADLIPQLGLWSALSSLPHPETKVAVQLGVILGGLAFFATYGVAVHLAWTRRAGVRRIAAAACVGAVCCTVSALAFPTANTDIFSYIASGRVASEHGANPYDVPPSAFPDDPVYPYVSDQYADNLPSKLPAWMLMDIGVARAAGDAPAYALLSFRLMLLTFALGSIALVPLILRRIHPRRALAGTIAFAWNPVLIVYGPSKTDTVMVFFLLLCVLFLSYRKDSLGVLSLGCSVLIKLITLPLVCLYLLRQARFRRWKQLALSVGLLAALTIVVYLPFTRDPGLLGHHLQLLRSVESADGVNRATNGSTVEHLARLALGAGLIVLVVWLARASRPGLARLLRDWALIALCFALFLVTTALPWYQLVPIALAAIAGSGTILGVAIAVSLSSFLLGVWQSASTASFQFDDLLGLPPVLVYLAPALLVALVVILQPSRRRVELRRFRLG